MVFCTVPFEWISKSESTKFSPVSSQRKYGLEKLLGLADSTHPLCPEGDLHDKSSGGKLMAISGKQCKG